MRAVGRGDLPAPRRSGALTLATAGLLIGLDLPFAGFFVPGTSLASWLGREALFWTAAVLIVVYVWFVERRPLASIGLRVPTWKTLAYGLLAGVVMVAGMAAIYLVLFPALHLSEVQALGSIKSLPLWLNVAIVARAAVFEELFYRGFAIERLTELTRRRWLAALLSWAAFTYAHLGFWGWGHLIVAGFGGSVLTGLYLWKRDLAANTIAHFFTDAVGLLLA